MSGQNLEKARRFYPTDRRIDIAQRFQQEGAARDLESQFGDVFHRDFETVDPTGTMSLTSRGMTGFIAAWREMFEAFGSWEVLADGFVESGDKVLVLLDIVARSLTDEVDLPMRAANVLTFSEEKIVRIELHTSTDMARRAAGLSGGPD